MRTKRKPSKRAALKKLHGALRSLLDKPNASIQDGKRISGIPEILPSSKLNSQQRKSSKNQVKKLSPTKIKGKDFILSREDRLMPKLTDNEIMERHKLADENMRRVWTSIIHKYETIEDQGDVLDLQTCEVVEDNGHIRGLSQDPSTEETRYQSVLTDIVDLEKEKYGEQFSLWGDNDVDEEEDGDYEVDNEAEDDADDETDYTEYNQLLRSRIHN